MQNYSGAITKPNDMTADSVYTQLEELAKAVDRLVQSSTYMKSAIKVKMAPTDNSYNSQASEGED